MYNKRMKTFEENRKILEQINGLYQDSAIRDRTYYPDFRRGWDAVLKRALNAEPYQFPEKDGAVFTVQQEIFGLSAEFSFDQAKMAEWFKNEQKRKSKAIFYPKRLKRSRNGIITYDDSVCRADLSAKEICLSEEDRNIIACAIPGLPPELAVVYGNKWVSEKFNPLLQRRISMFLVETDYVPAFLGSAFEVALYLFLMDYCIIKADYSKVKDEDLRKFLHIFRPSPMLKIKGLI